MLTEQFIKPGSPGALLQTESDAISYPRTCFSRMIEHPRCRKPWESNVDFS
jgi:hypothetical protein